MDRLLRSTRRWRRSLPLGTIMVCAAILFGAYAEIADAYVDPSAASTLMQFFVGGVVAGLLMMGRLFWSAVAAKFGFLKRSPAPRDGGEEQADASSRSEA